MSPTSIHSPQPEYPEHKVSFIITEGMKRKGITPKKLSEMTGIAPKYLESLITGNPDRLPPAPFLRSYLIAIGRALEFDGLLVWESMKSDELTLSAGSADRLPRHRFKKKPAKKIIYLVIAGVVVSLYLFFRLPEIIGQPTLSIGFPSEDVSTVNVTPVVVNGKVENGDSLQVNGESIAIGPDGFWEKSVPLEPGLNTIEITAGKFLGGEVKAIRQIIFEPGASLPGESTNGSTPTSTDKNTSSSKADTTSSTAETASSSEEE